MRTLRKNKQKMYYSLFEEEKPIYEMEVYILYPDKNTFPSNDSYPTVSNSMMIKYIEVDGVKIPVETGEKEVFYSVPVLFKANISMSGGESKQVEYGIDKSDYDAILIAKKDEFPIDETSLIWHESSVVYKDADKTIVDGNSADYRVKKVSPSLNQTKYLLEKIVK